MENKEGIGLSTFIKNMEALTDEQKSFIEGLDAAIGKALGSNVKSYLENELSLADLQKSYDEALQKIEELSKKGIDGKLEKGDFETFKKEIDSFKEDLNRTLVSIKVGTEKGANGEVKVKSLEQQIREQLDGFIEKKTNGEEAVNLKEACKKSDTKRKSFAILTSKAAITTGGANLLGGVTIDDTFTRPISAESDIRDYANVVTIGNRSVVYGEMYDINGDAEWVPESGLKPSMDAKVREVTVTAGKVALIVKLTEETLYDLPQIVAEIQAEIINRIGLAEENGILYGSGLDGEIQGVLANVPEYTLTGLSVKEPNFFDAIIAGYTQIVSVSLMNYRPNLVRVNPIDLANMQLAKDANGQYLFPPFSLANGELISGLKVVPTPNVDLGSYIMGDFRYLNIRDYMALTIEFGWDNDDFTKNLVTMIGEKRLLAYIKSNYLTAFLKGEYNTIMEAISLDSSTTP